MAVDDYRHFGQVHAEWRKNDPTTVEVFVFGGRITRCQPRSAGVRIVLRQLPLSHLPSQDNWSDTTTRMFDGVPDSCAAER